MEHSESEGKEGGREGGKASLTLFFYTTHKALLVKMKAAVAAAEEAKVGREGGREGGLID